MARRHDDLAVLAREAVGEPGQRGDRALVDGCRDRRPIAALSRLAHRFAGEDCEVVVAACHVDLLTFLDSVPTFSKLPVAFERPVETSR